MVPELQRPPWVHLGLHLQSPNEASDVALQISWLCFSRHLETLFPEVVKEHPCCLSLSLPPSLSWLPTVNRSTQPWGRRDFSLSPPSFSFWRQLGSLYINRLVSRFEIVNNQNRRRTSAGILLGFRVVQLPYTSVRKPSQLLFGLKELLFLQGRVSVCLLLLDGNDFKAFTSCRKELESSIFHVTK